jgi:hypothetical protein
MARSWPETAYHDEIACQPAAPAGVTKRARLVGRCWAAISAPRAIYGVREHPDEDVRKQVLAGWL